MVRMPTLQGVTFHSVAFIKAGTEVVIETTNGGRVFGSLTSDYTLSYAVYFVRKALWEMVPAWRIRDVRPLTAAERLLAWIRDHCHHAHICPDGRICVGIDAFTGDGAPFTTLEYVRTYSEARDALGY